MRDALSILPPPLCSRMVYSLPEVCTIANIGRSGLYEEIAAGAINVVKFDGKTRIERAELISYLERKPFQVPLPKNHDPDAALGEAAKTIQTIQTNQTTEKQR